MIATASLRVRADAGARAIGPDLLGVSQESQHSRDPTKQSIAKARFQELGRARAGDQPCWLAHYLQQTPGLESQLVLFY